MPVQHPIEIYLSKGVKYPQSVAGVAELADAADLKSAGVILVGSSPTPGTIKAGVGL